jgi:hypothetical protein
MDMIDGKLENIKKINYATVRLVFLVASQGISFRRSLTRVWWCWFQRLRAGQTSPHISLKIQTMTTAKEENFDEVRATTSCDSENDV